eukprot:TRINITY_DN9225_c0_g1_i1.p1 TRINITY_DN9225_c0_g1~~TRINITY_DN9225_c0_g1_i1.p1  ORF type:complete len:296 (+),score=62.75 TRINITY_DN9225_c0_g1_i1:26-913(+)
MAPVAGSRVVFRCPVGEQISTSQVLDEGQFIERIDSSQAAFRTEHRRKRLRQLIAEAAAIDNPQVAQVLAESKKLTSTELRDKLDAAIEKVKEDESPKPKEAKPAKSESRPNRRREREAHRTEDVETEIPEAKRPRKEKKKKDTDETDYAEEYRRRYHNPLRDKPFPWEGTRAAGPYKTPLEAFRVLDLPLKEQMKKHAGTQAHNEEPPKKTESLKAKKGPSKQAKRATKIPKAFLVESKKQVQKRQKKIQEPTEKVKVDQSKKRKKHIEFKKKSDYVKQQPKKVSGRKLRKFKQ